MSEPAPPVPLLDHVVVNVRERMAEAARLYRGLGFALSPLGRHTLGSVNHLAVFATDYLELLGVDPEAEAPRAELLAYPAGLNGLVFAAADAAAVADVLAARGVATGGAQDFSRPVALAQGGAADARFRTVRLAPQAAPYGRVYFCQHFTPELVWRAADRAHANRATAIRRVVLRAAAPAAAAALYRRMFGADAVHAVAGGFALPMGPARLDILSAAAVAEEFGAAAPPGGDDRFAALVLGCGDLAGARRLVGERALPGTARLLLPHQAAFGAALEFVA